MAAPRKYPEELRERAIRMAVDLRRDPATRTGALRRVGEQLGINPETLRNWVSQAEIDEGHRPGVTTAEGQRIAELERKVKELRRANEILKTASAFFAAAELDRKLKWPRRCWSTTSTSTARSSGSSRCAPSYDRPGCRSPRVATTPRRPGHHQHGPWPMSSTGW